MEQTAFPPFNIVHGALVASIYVRSHSMAFRSMSGIVRQTEALAVSLGRVKLGFKIEHH